MNKSFAELVGERYGNPCAVFVEPGEKLDSGTKVKVMPPHNTKADTLLDGVIVNKAKKRPAVKVTINKRVWFLPVHKHQVLKEW